MPALDAARAFAAFRIFFGASQCLVLLSLFPAAGELFSAEGLPGQLTGTAGMLGAANPLRAFPQPAFAQALILIAAACAAAIALGSGRRSAGVALWFAWVLLFDRHTGIVHPGLAYVGWLGLALAVVPPNEPWRPLSRRPDDPHWRMPSGLMRAAWLLLGAGYALSGLDKLASPSWLDGTAIHHVLGSPYARETGLRTLLVTSPGITLLLSRAALATELLFAPLALFRRTRPVAWLAATGMHLGILLTLDFAPLTLGMLAIHAFTFDADWLARRKETQGGVRS